MVARYVVPEINGYLAGLRTSREFVADNREYFNRARQAVMAKLKKFGKGIVLMHDFQQATAAAASDLLNDLKAGGYKVVFMKPKDSIKTIASYDELILKDQKLPNVSDRPTTSVLRTISE